MPLHDQDRIRLVAQLQACSALADATPVRKAGDGNAVYDSVSFSAPRSHVVVVFDDHGVLTIR